MAPFTTVYSGAKNTLLERVMKIAVFSDSHGRTAPIIAGIKAEKPDSLLFLGDGARDLDKIKAQFPDIPLRAVRGNCDYDSYLPVSDVITADGVRIFLTHGHLYGVKSKNLYALAEVANQSGATLALYGHTHTARIEPVGSVITLNPGSCGCGTASFAIVTTGGAGRFSCQIIGL
ncbi:MAG: metallophosphoesterase [Clostridia bacterium]|nr:metallophosphoesterase [Clostridia bacterium]